ncbi:MAG TPA: hypothetical protein HA362_03390 [Nanoarchaeota archaeon]|nr:hypothetical protein [Nanoarchaeota archaeon]
MAKLEGMALSGEEFTKGLSARLADKDVLSVLNGSPLNDRGVAEKIAGILVYAETNMGVLAGLPESVKRGVLALTHKFVAYIANGGGRRY